VTSPNSNERRGLKHKRDAQYKQGFSKRYGFENSQTQNQMEDGRDTDGTQADTVSTMISEITNTKITFCVPASIFCFLFAPRIKSQWRHKMLDICVTCGT